MKKRLLSMLLVLLMVISLIPASVLAVENDVTEPVDNTEDNAVSDGETPDDETPGDEIPNDETSDDGIEPLNTEPATYTVTFSVTNQSGAALTYTNIMISNAAFEGMGDSETGTVGSTIAYVNTNDEGIATYTLPDGFYYAYVAYTSGRYSYYDAIFFRVNGEDRTVTLQANTRYTNRYESTYNNTTYFDHVDIRVKGTATSGTNINLSSYGITLSNVHVIVNNPAVSGYQDYDFSFTNSTSYEWRRERIKVHKEAVVTVTCDIYINGELAQSGYSQSFFGKNDFVKAIEQCDGKQGLDFIINPLDILQAVMVDVSYQWTMADGSPVPANFPATLPSGETDKEPGYDHTINTHYQAGYYVIDENAGKMYTFSGWTHWSDEETEKTAIASDATTIELNSDTIIYGTWTATDLEIADQHIIITKTFKDAEGNDVTPPSDWHIKLVGPEGGTLEVSLSQFTNSNGVYTYRLPVYRTGEYTIEEHAYEVSGYTSAASATVTEATTEHSHITNENTSAGDGVTFEIEKLDYEVNSNHCDDIATVAFTNTYTKAIGEDVYNYPALRLNKMDADTRTALANAEFSLYKVGENNTLGELVSTQITDESGYAYFWDVEPGEYWLIETEAPDGYMAGYAQYKVIVTEKEGSPVEQLINGEYCMVHSYDMAVLVNIGDGNGWYPSDHFSVGSTETRFRLGAFNEKISGQLIVSKDIAGDLSENTYPTDIVVHVSGPNNFERVLTLNKDNGWSVTLTGLELGDYTITERDASVPGYEINTVIGTVATTTTTVTLDKTDVPANYVKNDPVAEETVAIVNTYAKIEGADVSILPDLHLQKYRTGTTDPVEGAEFTLTQVKDGNGNTPANPVVITRTTSNLGKITFATLKPGTYTLVETKAPTSYAADTTVYEVVVSEVKREEVLNSEQNHFYDIVTYDVAVTNAASGAFATDTNTIAVYNQKAYGNLTITKDFGVNSALDMSNMQGEIKLLVTGPNGYSKEVVMNDENNRVIFIDELPFGEYTIDEIDSTATRPGYDWKVDGDGQTVTVTAENETHTITITNTYSEIKVNPASFEIKKIDADDNSVIPGVVFGLYEGNTLVAQATTDTNGVAKFAGFIETKTYTLKEISTLENYILGNEEWTVKVTLKDGDPVIRIKEGTNFFESIYNWIVGVAPTSNWSDGVLTVTNKKILGDLTIEKEFGQNTEFTPAQVVVDVAGPDGYSETVTLNEKNNWTYTLTDLQLGEYTVTEQDASEKGYDLAVTGNGQKVTLDVASDTTPAKATITNTYTKIYGSPVLPDVEVQKYLTGTTTAIGSVEFTLYDANKQAIKSLVTDEKGQVSFADLAEGTYYIKETSAPEAYVADTTEYKVVVAYSSEALVEGKWIKTYTATVTPDANFANDTLTVYNDEAVGDITISKSFVDENGDEVTPPDGAIIEVALLDANNNLVQEIELTKDNAYKAVVSDIPVGNYTIKEVTASLHGYTWNNADFDVDGTVTKDAKTVEIKVTNEADIKLDITNKYTKWESVDFWVMKTADDGVTPLAGAEFTLYDANNKDVTSTYLHTGEGHPAGNVTGTTGILHFSGFTVPAGETSVTYYLKETEAPTNYYADSTVYEITISHDGNEYDITITGKDGAFNHGNDVLTVVNKEILGDLVIEKKFGDDNKFQPDSVKVTVTGPNNFSQVVTLEKDKNYSYTLKDLSLGVYTVIENDASQAGYTLDVKYTGVDKDNKVTLDVDNDTTPATVVITNTYTKNEIVVHNPDSFKISKIDGESGAPLQGVTFALYADKALTQNVTAQYSTNATSDKDGIVEFGGFTIDSTDPKAEVVFYLKEVSAPANYKVSDTVWKVTVKENDGEITVVLKADKNLFENIYDWIVGVDSSKFANGVLTVENSKIPGQLTITKAFNDNSAVKDGSYTVKVTGPDGYSEEVELNANNKYTVVLEKLEFGEYTVTEVNADKTGYNLTTTYSVAGGKVTIGKDDVANGVAADSVTVTNNYTKIYGAPVLPDVEVQKYLTGTTTAIGSVEFTLYDANKQVIKSLVTDEKGQVTFTDLAEGTYYIKETSAPEAYVADATEYKVVVAYSSEALVEGKWIKTYTATITPDANFANETLTVYNEKAVGNVTISKSFVDESGKDVTPPDGAIIEVALLDADGNVVQEVELSKANDWKYTVEKLPIGEYTVFENIPSLHGYTWTKADFTVTGTAVIAATNDSVKFKVENGADIEVGVKNNYKEWDSVDFYVLKTTEDGDTPLAGATFKLYSNANLTTDVTANYLHIDPSIHSYTTNTTASTGVLHFHGFDVANGETAVFYLKETAAPVNYYVNSTIYKVTITHDNAGYDINITDKDGNAVSFNHGNDVLTVVNHEILGDLKIEKKFGNGNKFQPDSVKVTVTGPNNYSQVVTLDESNGYTVTLTNLHLGEYTVIENDASQAGYTLDVKYTGVDKDNKVTLGADSATSPASVVITNTYTKNEIEVHNPDSFKICKVDAESGAPLQGVTFALYADKELTQNVTAKYCANPTSDKDGIIEFSGFAIENSNDPKAEEVFYLKETSTLANYKISGTVWKVTVKENNGEVTVVLKADKNLFENIFDWVVGVDSSKFANGVLTVENSKIPGQLTITKAFDADSDVKDGSYTVKVTGPDGYSKEVELNANNKYTVVLEKLEFGEYTVTEFNADKTGYTLTTTYSVADGKVTIGKDDVANGVAADSVTVTNLYEKIYGDSVMPELYVQKYRSNTTTPLGGAWFDLTYTHDENGNPARGGISIMTDSATGKVGFNLAYPGTYTLVESESPDTYAENNAVYTIVVKYGSEELVGDKWIKTYVIDSVKIGNTPVSLGANNTLVVYNTKDEGTITVEKLFGTNSVLNADTLTGDIKVQVMDSNNQVVDTLTLNKEGQWKATTKLLPLGTYTLKEIEADRDGYYCNVTYTSEGRVEITADVDEPKVNITNTYTTDIYNPTYLEIKKVDSVDGTPIEGVVFGLYADGVSEPVFTATTDSTGGAVFSDLDEAAVYTLKEITPHADYVGTTTTWKVTVELDNDGKPVVTEVEANTGLFENIFNWIVGVDPDSEYTGGVLTVANTKKTGTLTITKAVEYYLDGEMIQYSELPGEFKDLVDSKYGFEFEVNGEKADFELADGGKHTTEELPYGTTYKVGEVLDADSVFNCYVDVEDTDGIVDAESKTIEFVNRYFFWSYTESREDPKEIFEYDWTTFEVTKTDAATDKPLADAEFTLYSDKECTTAVATDVSDENGHLEFVIKAAGTYYLKETKAPAGYIPDDTVYTVIAKAWYEPIRNAEDGFVYVVEHVYVDETDVKVVNNEYVIENEPYAQFNITVKKVWVSRGNMMHPESVEVALYRDGEIYETVKLSKDNNWTYTWTVTEEHEWSVDEPTVPTGYVKDVQVKDNVYTITNTHRDIPNTGDNSNLLLLTVLVAMSAMGMVTVTIAGKKRRNSK